MRTIRENPKRIVTVRGMGYKWNTVIEVYDENIGKPKKIKFLLQYLVLYLGFVLISTVLVNLDVRNTCITSYFAAYVWELQSC